MTPSTRAASYAAMLTTGASVSYAIACAERDEWTIAAEAYRTSTGAEHIDARRVFWPMVRAERAGLLRQRAELREAAMRAVERRAA